MGVMTSEDRAAASDAEFERLTAPHRRELLAHCYRMLGSSHDAQDLLQETMIRAWRSFDRYDDSRASLRTWLYRIATNACLTALEGRQRRPLPSGLGGPGDDPYTPLVPAFDVPWMEPMADAMVGLGGPTDPAHVAVARGSIRLALVTALQRLPARQRAALLLRDVLDYSALEVADMLDTTPAAVNSALQRARVTLGDAGVSDGPVPSADDAQLWVAVERYIDAFERADIDELTRLLTDDVVMEMPPVPLWFRGRTHFGAFLERAMAIRGTDWRMVSFAANGQPAAAAYCGAEDGGYQAHSIQVFDGPGPLISSNVVFAIPDLFEFFGLPLVLPSGGDAAVSI
jgi:RNA polymerase sigma-70 factor (ECF subfamily)